jgi:hypothetical protein
VREVERSSIAFDKQKARAGEAFPPLAVLLSLQKNKTAKI